MRTDAISHRNIRPGPWLAPRAYPSRLSLVIPLFNEREVLPLLREALNEFLPQIPTDVEVVLVDDGSSDETFALSMAWAAEDRRVKVLGLARNFGHQAAATAGLDHATGDAVVLMDADLQDPLAVIPEMIAEYCNGFDVVYGKRRSRQGETLFKRATAWAFYRVMRMLIYSSLPPDTGDFRLISRRCLDALLSLRETHRFLRGMVAWVGFPQKALEYDRRPRAAGSTKYPLRKMVKFAWTAAVSFSPTPLRLSFALGGVLALTGISQGIYAVGRKLLGLYTVPGWTSLMVAMCLIGAAILLSIGVLGEYVGRVFEEIKGRPLYIVADAANVTASQEEPGIEVAHELSAGRDSR